MCRMCGRKRAGARRRVCGHPASERRVRKDRPNTTRCRVCHRESERDRYQARGGLLEDAP